MDKIVGMIHRMDFYTGGGVTDRPLSEIMTSPLFVLRTEKLDDLLQKLRATKAHLAVVVDEYGGTQGIVTMEDILEELVGEIWDEHDVAEEPVRELADGSYRVEGGFSLEDFCDRFGFKTDSESISVGGWAMEKLGRIPQEGDSFCCDGLRITVAVTENFRIKALTVRRME